MKIIELDNWLKLTDLIDEELLNTPKDQDIDLLFNGTQILTLHLGSISQKKLKRDLKKQETIYFPSLKPQEVVVSSSIYSIFVANDYSFLEEEFQAKNYLDKQVRKSEYLEETPYFSFLDLTFQNQPLDKESLEYSVILKGLNQMFVSEPKESPDVDQEYYICNWCPLSKDVFRNDIKNTTYLIDLDYLGDLCLPYSKQYLEPIEFKIIKPN